MKNESLIKDIISRIRITEADYKANTKDGIGKARVCFDLLFDSTHESAKWFKEKVEEDKDIRYAIADSLINRFAEPVDEYMEQIKEDEQNEGGFYADVILHDWDDEKCSFILETEFPF